MQNKEKNNGANNNKPFNTKYEQVRLLGEGSFGKAFLVESIEEKVNTNYTIIKVFSSYQNNRSRKYD